MRPRTTAARRRTRNRSFGNAPATAVAALAIWISACATATPTTPPEIAAAEPGAPVAKVQADEPVEPDFTSTAEATQPGLTCRQAVGTARGALVRMGYDVNGVRRPEPNAPGEIRGSKLTGWEGDPGPDSLVLVRITCDNEGAKFDASTTLSITGRIGFRRDFPKQIAAVANRNATRHRAKKAKVETGLAIEVTPLRGGAVQVFGADFTAVGITPVHVLIRNVTPQTYILETSRLQLVTQEGQRRSALAAEEVEALVPDEARAAVRRNSLSDGTIDPSATLDGYLFFPASTYRRAKVVLTDRESDESEGFSIEF